MFQRNFVGAAICVVLLGASMTYASAAEPDLTLRLPVETRNVPDAIEVITISCSIKDSTGEFLAEKGITLFGTEISMTVIVELTFDDRTKCLLAKSWECYLFLHRGGVDWTGYQPLAPGESCDHENVWYLYLCGRDGQPFRRTVSGVIQ